jgi:hypothetical protein
MARPHGRAIAYHHKSDLNEAFQWECRGAGVGRVAVTVSTRLDMSQLFMVPPARHRSAPPLASGLAESQFQLRQAAAKRSEAQAVKDCSPTLRAGPDS